MCDPVSLAMMGGSMALSATGGAMKKKAAAKDYAAKLDLQSKQGQQQVDEAAGRNAVLKDYLGRQSGYRAENDKVFSGAVSRVSPTATYDPAVAARTKASDAAVAGGPAFDSPYRAGAPAAVGGAFSDRVGKAVARAQDSGARMAKVGAYGDAANASDATVANAGDRIKATNTIARSDIALLPNEQELTAVKYRKPLLEPQPSSTGLADLLQSLGSLGGAVAGSGMFGAPKAVPAASGFPNVIIPPGYGNQGWY